jgi:dTDP-4-amino-4,6-dideoxygalactose transaminase
MDQLSIVFNKPYLTGKEMHYMYQAVYSGKISGNGMFTKKCQEYFETKYGFKKSLLTTSCTTALEMCAILANIKSGDEVIMPSYTFVSTALAFVRQGAKIVFADSNDYNPNLDADRIEELINERTKAIVVVHYAGIACDMDKILHLSEKYGIIVIEDAAQAIDSFHLDRPLGSLGLFSAFSFHETKNINSGEGGMIVINDRNLFRRSEIIWEKGTNRSEFFRGEIDKYGWVDTGSSFLPSEIIAAYLYAQLENLDGIQKRRKMIWQTYYQGLRDLEKSGIMIPFIPDFATNNAHMFYLVCHSVQQRSDLINFLKKRSIHAVFHYQSLHKSVYYKEFHDGRELINSDRYTDCLVRLPLFYELSDDSVEFIVKSINDFFEIK